MVNAIFLPAQRKHCCNRTSPADGFQTSHHLFVYWNGVNIQLSGARYTVSALGKPHISRFLRTLCNQPSASEAQLVFPGLRGVRKCRLNSSPLDGDQEQSSPGSSPRSRCRDLCHLPHPGAAATRPGIQHVKRWYFKQKFRAVGDALRAERVSKYPYSPSSP